MAFCAPFRFHLFHEAIAPRLPSTHPAFQTDTLAANATLWQCSPVFWIRKIVVAGPCHSLQPPCGAILSVLRPGCASFDRTKPKRHWGTASARGLIDMRPVDAGLAALFLSHGFRISHPSAEEPKRLRPRQTGTRNDYRSIWRYPKSMSHVAKMAVFQRSGQQIPNHRAALCRVIEGKVRQPWPSAAHCYLPAIQRDPDSCNQAPASHVAKRICRRPRDTSSHPCRCCQAPTRLDEHQDRREANEPWPPLRAISEDEARSVQPWSSIHIAQALTSSLSVKTILTSCVPASSTEPTVQSIMLVTVGGGAAAAAYSPSLDFPGKS